MTTTLMKTCLLGMAGAMTFSLVACGNKFIIHRYAR